jgi:ribonuclease D
VIADQSRLEEVLPGLEASGWIAIDTEADSLHAYPEKLCLLQISSEEGDHLVDTLSQVNLAPLLKIFKNHQLILHGADYDLRLLRRTFNFIPTHIFDTMTAARLLGYTQFGLQHLVEKHLGVKLEKGAQKMNWARRPLTNRMEEYARNDTRYLRPLADVLRAQLEQKGRLEWQNETCAQLIDDCAEVPVVDADSVWRMRGSDRLDRRGLAVLKELWKWREKEAVAANKPPFFILNHDVLLSLAHEAERIPHIERLIPPRLSTRKREAILHTIAHAKNIPDHDLPSKRVNVLYQPTVDEQRRFFALRQSRDRKAHDLGIDPTLIASRSTLVLLSQDFKKYEDKLMHWQRKLLDEAMDELHSTHIKAA